MGPLETLTLERLGNWIPMVLSLTVHEWAHARAAAGLGDPTAQSQGRLSLNPFVHIDPVGTLLMPLRACSRRKKIRDVKTKQRLIVSVRGTTDMSSIT
jgi:hypothetical protein